MVFNLVAAGVALGATALGGFMQFNSAKDQSAAQQAQIAAEQRAEEIRRRAMKLDARRRTMEIVRQQQRARAMALTIGTAQGTAQSSGLQGAYGGIAGQSGVNAMGVQQNLLFGKQMFAANEDISSARMSYAQAGEQGALGRGISSIGSTIFANIGPLSSMAAGFGGAGAAAAPSYGGWYNLSQTGGHPFPTPYS